MTKSDRISILDCMTGKQQRELYDALSHNVRAANVKAFKAVKQDWKGKKFLLSETVADAAVAGKVAQLMDTKLAAFKKDQKAKQDAKNKIAKKK